MAIYKCKICGHIYDENKEQKLFSELDESWVCPICGAPKSMFEKVESEGKVEELKENKDKDEQDKNDLMGYLKEYARATDEVEEYMADIHSMAVNAETIIAPMGTKLPVINWRDILIMGAQLNPLPLNEHQEVNIQTVIGKKAKKPMVLESPVYISHMSFGALSKEMKISLAKGAAMNKTAICSGEGGMLPEEYNEAYKYIFEYVPNKYSVTDENLKKADAIEIKIGQGTKPGMGGHLPAQKVTEEISKIRNKPMGHDVISPSRFEEIETKEDLKGLVDMLREKSEGRPIGIKIAAGKIEKDMEWIEYAKPDFMTIDGRGGATGASPKFLKDASSVPTIFALYRAKKYIIEHNLEIDLVITGGLRISSDIAKAIAMGADAVAISTAAMMAAACQQYRICNSGMCPVGAATQDEKLRSRLKIENSAKRVGNFLNVTAEELRTYCRITGHKDIHELSIEDICTTNSEISNHTNIEHA